VYRFRANSFFHSILIFYYVIEAFGEMLCSLSRTTILAKISPVNKRGRYMGFLTLFQRAIAAFGPFIGVILMGLLIPSLLFHLTLRAVTYPLYKLFKSRGKSGRIGLTSLRKTESAAYDQAWRIRSARSLRKYLVRKNACSNSSSTSHWNGNGEKPKPIFIRLSSWCLQMISA